MVGCFTFRTVALYIHRNNWVIIAGQLDKAIASLHHLALSFCSRPIVGSTPLLLYIDVISRIVHTHIRHIPTQFLILVDENCSTERFFSAFNVIYKPIPSAFSCPVHTHVVSSFGICCSLLRIFAPPFPRPFVVHAFIQSRAIVRP